MKGVAGMAGMADLEAVLLSLNLGIAATYYLLMVQMVVTAVTAVMQF